MKRRDFLGTFPLVAYLPSIGFPSDPQGNIPTEADCSIPDDAAGVEISFVGTEYIKPIKHALAYRKEPENEDARLFYERALLSAVEDFVVKARIDLGR